MLQFATMFVAEGEPNCGPRWVQIEMPSPVPGAGTEVALSVCGGLRTVGGQGVAPLTSPPTEFRL